MFLMNDKKIQDKRNENALFGPLMNNLKYKINDKLKDIEKQFKQIIIK